MTTSLPLLPFSGEERMRITAFLPVPTDVQNQEIVALVMNQLYFFFLNKQQFSHALKKESSTPYSSVCVMGSDKQSQK